MFSIFIFDAGMNRVGEFRCQRLCDAVLTWKDFIQCGYTASLRDGSKELAIQYVHH